MIRLATIADIPRIVEMGLRFITAESKYKNFIAADPEKMRLTAEKLLENDGWLVSERDGKVCGMIGIFIYPHFISGEMIAGEVAWWVEPEHRGEGVKLMREAEKRAKEKGAVKMQMIAPTEQVGRVYEQMGYKFVESTYQRKL